MSTSAHCPICERLCSMPEVRNKGRCNVCVAREALTEASLQTHFKPRERELYKATAHLLAVVTKGEGILDGN